MTATALRSIPLNSLTRRVGIAGAAFGVMGILASQVARARPMAHADQAAFAAVRSRRHPIGVAVARAISTFAEPALTYPVAILAGVATSGRTSRPQSAAPVATVATGATARRRVSRVIGRSRPPSTAWLIEPEGFSFPSKHTTAAALTAGACARALSPRGHGFTTSTVAVLLMGGSRVYLGVHWPGDVLAGWLFAVGWLCLTDSRGIHDQGPKR